MMNLLSMFPLISTVDPNQKFTHFIQLGLIETLINSKQRISTSYTLTPEMKMKDKKKEHPAHNKGIENISAPSIDSRVHSHGDLAREQSEQPSRSLDEIEFSQALQSLTERIHLRSKEMSL